jgi:nucleoside 2-deoxyribosyltransferase
MKKRKNYQLSHVTSIKSTISSIGWNPVIVDEVEHNDGIMDKVLASINSSAFVVAELTYQKTGVYYEAGFAKGKGLPVIHIVNREDFDNCHFDVRHLNLIVWESLEELRGKLESRILATIGKPIS